MKFLMEFDKILPHVITLFTEEELNLLIADTPFDVARFQVSHGLKIRNLILSSHGKFLLGLGEDCFSELDALTAWLLWFLYFLQKSKMAER